MNQPKQEDELLSRISKLESQVKTMRVWSLVAVAVLGFSVLVGFESKQVTSLLKANRFQIVGDDGNVQMDLRSRKGTSGGSLTINDRFGDAKFLVEVNQRGGHLALGEGVVTHDKESVIALDSSSVGSFITAQDQTGASIIMGVRKTTGSIRVEDGKERLVHQWPANRAK